MPGTIGILMSLILATALIGPSVAFADECTDIDGNVIDCLPAEVCTDAEGNAIDCLPAEICTDAEGNVIDCPTDESGDSDEAGEAEQSKPTPPGQMVRRGLSGPIASWATDGEGNITAVFIQTNFGLVQLDVSSLGLKDGDLAEGTRVAVKLAKQEEKGASSYAQDSNSGDISESDTGEGDTGEGGTGEGGSDEGDIGQSSTGEGDTGEGETGDQEELPDAYRTAVPEQFNIIPTKASRSHKYATVVETSDDGLTIMDEDGETEEVDGDSGGDGLPEEGDDVVLILQDNGHGNKPTVTGSEQTSNIQARLELWISQAEETGDEALLERLQQRLEKQIEKQEQRADKWQQHNSTSGDSDSGESHGKGAPNGNNGNAGGNGHGGGKNK